MIERSHPQLKKLQPRDKQNRPIRVLYVEDAEVLRDTMVQLLEIYGYKVATAKNGQEGIEVVLQWKPDLVLMDLRMPVMDGYQAIQEIRGNSQTHHLPIFVISAWSSQKERNQAQLAGADAFFVKPADLDRLNEAIKGAVAASAAKVH